MYEPYTTHVLTKNHRCAFDVSGEPLPLVTWTTMIALFGLRGQALLSEVSMASGARSDKQAPPSSSSANPFHLRTVVPEGGSKRKAADALRR